MQRFDEFESCYLPIMIQIMINRMQWPEPTMLVLSAPIKWQLTTPR